MLLEVKTYADNRGSSLGLLFIDGIFECYTLEDKYSFVKIAGKTRIPRGLYRIGLRTVGGFNARYKKRFDFHEGMLEVKNVPDFKYVLIHSGNTKNHTAGCLLVGNSANNNNINEGFISNSRQAYKKMYLKVLKAIKNGEKVLINYTTIDQFRNYTITKND